MRWQSNTNMRETTKQFQADPDQAQLMQQATAALDASVERLDGATLSQLNKARQQALEARRAGPLRRLWLPLGAAVFTSLAIVVSLPMLGRLDNPGPAEVSVEEAYYSASEDLELVEDLDLVLWLLGTDDHAS